MLGTVRGRLGALSLGGEGRAGGALLSLQREALPTEGGRRWKNKFPRGPAPGRPPGFRGQKPRYYWNPSDLAEQTAVYTTRPLIVKRQGGRDPETGVKANQRCGGGAKFEYLMVDLHRDGPSDPGAFYAERVLEVRRHPTQGPYVALVAGTRGKRWILATDGLEAGVILQTTRHMPSIPVEGQVGNAYPLGALAVGTQVCCVERLPGSGAHFARHAGTSCVILRRFQGRVVIRHANKRESSLQAECMAVVGQLSHKDWSSKSWGSANMHRRFGWKQSSGLYHKKDGYSGRKYWPIPPTEVIDEPLPEPLEPYAVTLTSEDFDCRFGNSRTNPFMLEGLELNGKYELA